MYNNTSEKREIIVEVTNYRDLCTLMQPWPYDAFNKGVKPFLNGIEELPLTIFYVEKSIILKPNTVAMSLHMVL